jgi:hypothetical protein
VKRVLASLMGIGILITSVVISPAMDEQESIGAVLWSAATLPASVQKLASKYSDQCRQLGGTLPSGSETPAVMTADLDGDGIQDYVLNPQYLRCSAAATAFCGNGGCDIKIALSRDAYAQPVSVLGGQPTMTFSSKNPVVEIWVDRTHCNLSDRSKACWAIYSWSDGKASTVYRTRPLPE